MVIYGYRRHPPRKSKFSNPDLAQDEMGRPCRRCHDDVGKCRCVAWCGVLVCTGAKEEEPDE